MLALHFWFGTTIGHEDCGAQGRRQRAGEHCWIEVCVARWALGAGGSRDDYKVLIAALKDYSKLAAHWEWCAERG